MFFYRNPLKWIQNQKLVASGDANPAGDGLGLSVSLNSTGDKLVVGAFTDKENGAYAGSVYAFKLTRDY